MLWGLTFALLIAVTLGFMGMSYRFDNAVSNRKFKTLASHPLVSILIPTYNSEKSISKTLESVQKSDYPNKEIIVVNDSNDRTPEIARSFGASVIQNSSRKGKGAALNKAAKVSNGEFLLILDADTTLSKDTLTRLVQSYNMYDDMGGRIGVVAPRYAARNNKNFIARLSDMEQKLHQSLLKIQMNLGSILSIRGSCLLIDRQAFDDVGGFSSTLLEDGDFTAKVIKADYKIKYEPSALVEINEPETWSALLSAKKRYGKGMFYCTFNHRKPYIISPQAFVCFYPQFLLMLAVIGTLIFHNPLTLAPITMLLTSFAISGITSYAVISLVTLVSVLGTFVGSHALTAPTAAARSGLTITVLPFVLFFIPIVTAAYGRGFISGVADKLHGRPELEFSNWK
jgi:cellulose synthase/poly-beta-1,6-N-acetylglucosamine synthase-like glycosyltransferase